MDIIIAMANHLWVRVAAGLGVSAVALGAFGAHGLKDILVRHNSLGTWETAAHYHLIHAVALLALAGSPFFKKHLATCFLVGVLIFSGSLYLLALTGQRWLGAVTPVGGVFFLIGWLGLAFTGQKSRGAV